MVDVMQYSCAEELKWSMCIMYVCLQIDINAERGRGQMVTAEAVLSLNTDSELAMHILVRTESDITARTITAITSLIHL